MFKASIRRLILKLIERDEKQSSIVDVIGVSRQTINEWVSKKEEEINMQSAANQDIGRQGYSIINDNQVVAYTIIYQQC